MPVSNVKIYGLDESIAASKYPMSVDTASCTPEITPRVKTLAAAELGSGHDQFLTGIIVQFDLTFSSKAWVEAERYHFLDFVSSQSTMHRITKLDPEVQCNEYVSNCMIENLKTLIAQYNDNPTPENYLCVLYNSPAGYKLTARMTTNYRQLKTIYAQRKSHRLPEWRAFCDWIETLPHSEFITAGEEKGWTANEFMIEALRTANGMNKEYPMWVNGALGLNGEAGEVADIVKKHLFQGHPLDVQRLLEELGDVAWYTAVMAHALGSDFNTVLQMNVDKLRNRYPNGFEAERSLNRE